MTHQQPELETDDPHFAEAENPRREFQRVFAEAVRRTAYFLWQQDGEPHGRHEEYYLRALDMHRRQRDYDRWLTDTPGGEAGS